MPILYVSTMSILYVPIMSILYVPTMELMVALGKLQIVRKVVCTNGSGMTILQKIKEIFG